MARYTIRAEGDLGNQVRETSQAFQVMMDLAIWLILGVQMLVYQGRAEMVSQ